jgi:dephospho-CoA kinase
MKVIGLTGGIASGKTTITKRLEQLGAALIDADVISRQLMSPGSPVLEEISRVFGTSYIDEKGNLQRKALAQLIFQDPKQRLKLEAMTHPLIRKEIQKQLDQYQKAEQKVAVLSAPLLFEAGLEDLVDEVWVVSLNQEAQVQRLMVRDNLSRNQALNRLAAQISLEERLSKADQIIDNNGTIADTLKQIDALWRKVND